MAREGGDRPLELRSGEIEAPSQGKPVRPRGPSRRGRATVCGERRPVLRDGATVRGCGWEGRTFAAIHEPGDLLGATASNRFAQGGVKHAVGIARVDSGGAGVARARPRPAADGSAAARGSGATGGSSAAEGRSTAVHGGRDTRYRERARSG